MTLTEVINKLNEIKLLDPDIKVYVIADHGQDLTRCIDVDYSWINQQGEEVHIDDVNDYEPDEVERIVVLS